MTTTCLFGFNGSPIFHLEATDRMSGKSIWQSITQRGGAGSGNDSTVKQLNTQTRKCAAGHPMGADWTECPYCSYRSTRAEETSAREPHLTEAENGGNNESPGRRTRVFEPEPGSSQSSSSGDRVTKVFQDPDDRRDPIPPGRLITGIVYTYTWSKLGQLFPLYAGRNYVGTTSTTRDGERMEVLVTEDTTMSSTHCLILHQQGRYLISDCHSTNGTSVDNQPVTPQGMELRDGALIKAGNTVLVFKKVSPPTL
jgi:hypothetical protein